MIDRLQRFPSQDIIGRPDDCTMETVADIWGNIQNQPFTPDFTDAATMRVMNVLPTTAGADPYAAMLSALIYGCLPSADDPTDVSTGSELFAANWANYSPEDIHLASLFPAKGITTLPLWEDICDYLYLEKQGVMLAMRWYSSFMTPLPDGTLPAPSGSMSNHCVAVYGSDSRGLQVKPWLGKDFGQGGYCYLPEAIYNQVLVESYAFNLGAWRWLQLARAALARPWLIPDILPQLRT